MKSKSFPTSPSFWLAAAAILLLAISILILVFALLPGDTLRVQATLAPTLFSPPPVSLP